ncbi:MAG: DUF3472 domain-containing protein [Verrucomicrobiota bacterium]|jgi:hypothetical protein
MNRTLQKAVAFAVMALPACLVHAIRAPAPSILYGTNQVLADGIAAMTDLKVEVSATGTYWCTLEWNTGYLGLQRGGSGYAKHVHFSVWDPSEGGLTQLVYQDANTAGGRFGGEGTGVVTYYPFDWLEGVTYTFAIKCEPYKGGTEYRGYFYDPVAQHWTQLATIQRPGAPSTLGYVGGFLEDFADTDSVQRSGLYGNCWIQDTNGVWKNYPQVYFNASIPLPSQTDYDGETAGTLFRLETGGSTTNTTPVQTWQSLAMSQTMVGAPTYSPVLGIGSAFGVMPNQVILLTWSPQETGWRTETRSQLSPSNQWTVVAVEPVLTNSSYQLTRTNAGNSAFFRLRKP